MTTIIDSHVHIWDPAAGGYGWLTGDLARAHLPADYEAASPATGVVFVEAGADDALAEARWVDSLAWPELLGIVARAPLEHGDRVTGVLEELHGIRRVVGVRRNLQGEPLAFLEQPGLVEGLRRLAATGLPFDACIRHHQLPALTALVAKVPGLRVVLDHLGKPPVAAGDDGTWRANLAELAANPLVSVKLSGVPPESSPDELVRGQALPYLAAALDAFGPARCMLGSDWPVSAVTAHRLAPGEWFANALDDLGLAGQEREQVAWRSAAAFYEVELP